MRRWRHREIKQQSSQLVSGKATIGALQAESRAVTSLCCIKPLPETGSFRRGTRRHSGDCHYSDWILPSLADSPPTPLGVKCFSNTQDAVRPQGLCTGCSRHLKHFFKSPAGKQNTSVGRLLSAGGQFVSSSKITKHFPTSRHTVLGSKRALKPHPTQAPSLIRRRAYNGVTWRHPSMRTSPVRADRTHARPGRPSRYTPKRA